MINASRFRSKGIYPAIEIDIEDIIKGDEKEIAYAVNVYWSDIQSLFTSTGYSVECKGNILSVIGYGIIDIFIENDWQCGWINIVDKSGRQSFSNVECIAEIVQRVFK